MKKKAIAITVTLIAVVALLATGCAKSVPEADYNRVVSERDQARAQVTSLQGELASAEDRIAALEEGTVIPELEEQVANLESELDTAVSERDELRGQVASLQDELSAAEEQIAALEEGTVILELEGQITALEQQIAAAAQYADLLSWHVTPQEELDLTGLVAEWQTRLQEVDDTELSAIIEELETYIDSQLAEELTDEEIAESAEYQEIHERISNHIIQKVAEILAAE